jgi:hypothetical protein
MMLELQTQAAVVVELLLEVQVLSYCLFLL